MSGFSLRRLAIVAAVVGISLLSTTPQAEAAFRMRIESGGVGVVITDNGAGDIAGGPGGLGTIVFTGPVGTFTVNVTTGITKPVIGGVSNDAEMHLNNVSVSSAIAGSLRITLEDTDYNGGSNPLEILGMVGGTLTAPTGSSVTGNTWFNPDNLVPALGADQGVGAIGAIGGVPAGSVAAFSPNFSFGPGAFSASAAAGVTRNAGPYSLFQQVTLNFTGPGIASFDLDTQILPEPSTVAMALTGLPLLAGFALRRYRRARA